MKWRTGGESYLHRQQAIKYESWKPGRGGKLKKGGGGPLSGDLWHTHCALDEEARGSFGLKGSTEWQENKKAV